MKIIKALLSLFKRKPNRRRLAVRLVNYGMASRMVDDGWTIAPEEDRNRNTEWVWLEKLEPLP